MKPGISALVLILALVASEAAPSPADTPSASSRATVEITFRTVGRATLPPSWDVLLRPAAAQEEPASRYPVKAGEPLHLKLAPGSSWEVSADLPGFWVPRKTLLTGGAGVVSH